MWQIMLDKGYVTTQEAAKQMDALYHHRKDITDIHGKCFSFEPLLQAYATFLKTQRLEDFYAIGKAQRHVPAWYIYAFCEQGKDKAWPTKKMHIKVAREIGKESCRDLDR